jgi:hypothetical protein
MSLRPGQLELTRLAWALGISLAIHLAGYGVYEAARKLNLWPALQLPAWLQKTRTLLSERPEIPEEAPLVYVDVSPRQAVREPPTDAKFYSSRNSQAANPEADQDTGMPKINGTQTEVVKTEDTPRGPRGQLQPTPGAGNEEVQAPPPIGDLALYGPAPELRPEDGRTELPKPRTLREAQMRQQRDQLVGEKMKSEGGVKRRLELTALDAKATPFGDYDEEFLEIIQSRWDDLLAGMNYAGYRRGKVLLEFRLHSDGQITDVKVLDENVGAVLSLMCRKALSDPAPYRAWPREMRLMVDKDYQERKLGFFYN